MHRSSGRLEQWAASERAEFLNARHSEAACELEKAARPNPSHSPERLRFKCNSPIGSTS